MNMSSWGNVPPLQVRHSSSQRLVIASSCGKSQGLSCTAVNILVIARNPGKTAIFLSLTTVRLIPSWIVSRPRSSRNRGKTARNRVFSLRLRLRKMFTAVVSNPASNPELLEALGKHFTDTKYNLKALVRDICNSRTYQRATERNESNAGDERNFAHAQI